MPNSDQLTFSQVCDPDINISMLWHQPIAHNVEKNSGTIPLLLAIWANLGLDVTTG
jgi:hypothetical protein